MKATNKSEQRQDCRREGTAKQSDLDKRYGEIGISAVAAAVCHQPKRQAEKPTKEAVPRRRH